MIKRLLPALGLLVALPLSAAGEPQQAARAERHSPRDAAHWATVWDGEARNEWQKPVDVMRLLTIEPGQQVADLGAGTGYFTRLLASVVGAEGRVYAVDVAQAMLDHLAQRDDIVQSQVITVLAQPDDPGLPEHAIDLVLIANTWNEIKRRPVYLQRLERCLAPDGRVVLIDFHAGELPVGPQPKKKIGRDQAVEEFERAGWRLVSESVALPYQYFLTFYPPTPTPPLFPPS